MAVKILSIIFLTLNLFIGESVPETLNVNYVTEDGNVIPQTLEYGNSFFYALADHTVEGQVTYTKIASDEVLNGEQSFSNYAIIVPGEDANVSVEGYDDIKFEGKYLTDNGDGTYTFSNEYNLFTPNYLVFEFNPRYKLNSMSVTGVNMSAGDVVTDKATLEFDITGSDAIFGDVHKLQENCFYLDADKFDQFFEKYEKVDTSNVDEFIGGVITKDEKLISGKRYYALVSGLYYEDFNCLVTYEGEDLPVEKELERIIGKSSNLAVTINGKKANRLNIDLTASMSLEEYKADETTNAVTPMRNMVTTLGKYYTEFVANETTKTTDLEYKVLETYEWVISSATQENVDGKIIDVLTDKNEDNQVEVNVEVNKWALEKNNKLVITVDSLNDWNMVDQGKPSNMSEYTITTVDGDDNSSNDVAWDENTPLITLEGIGPKARKSNSEESNVCSGIFSWNDGEPAWAGTYKDTLTFTAEVIAELPMIGGRIFYDAGAENGATYKFYDKDRKLINYVPTGDGNTDGLSNAYYYTVDGTPTNDRFFVYATIDGTPNGDACVEKGITLLNNGDDVQAIIDFIGQSPETLPESSPYYPYSVDVLCGKRWFTEYSEVVSSINDTATAYGLIASYNDNCLNSNNDWYLGNKNEMMLLLNNSESLKNEYSSSDNCNWWTCTLIASGQFMFAYYIDPTTADWNRMFTHEASIFVTPIRSF